MASMDLLLSVSDNAPFAPAQQLNKLDISIG
jgi:hypothetical protein